MFRVSCSKMARPTSLLVLAGALLVLAFACDRGTAPSSVEFALRGGFPADGLILSDTGVELQLRSAKLTVLAVELRPCVSAVRMHLRDLIGPARAYAHSAGSPTRLGVPNVIDLLASTARTLGNIAPPAGRYCSTRLSLGPADADAEGLPDPTFVGTTFALEADARAPTARTLDGVVSGNITVDVAFEPALSLAEGEDVRVELVFGDGDAIDGLDLSGRTDDAVASELVFGAQRSTQVIVAR